MSGNKIKSENAHAQTHLSKLILQSQEQVGERAQWLLCLFQLSGSLGREFFIEVFLDSSCRSVQSAHLFTQPGLVVLHHVEYALNIGVNWMTGACRL